jgi:fluoroacetyl-CoA thioesterase
MLSYCQAKRKLSGKRRDARYAIQSHTRNSFVSGREAPGSLYQQNAAAAMNREALKIRYDTMRASITAAEGKPIMEIKPGLQGTSTLIVADEHTAAHFGAGGVRVLGTPMMIGLMENAAFSALQALLPEGQTSVGTRVDIRHLAATPIGMRVTATAELLEVDGRRLLFRVEARDEKELIGEGQHERAIITLDRFLSRVEEKAKGR